MNKMKETVELYFGTQSQPVAISTEFIEPMHTKAYIVKLIIQKFRVTEYQIEILYVLLKESLKFAFQVIFQQRGSVAMNLLGRNGELDLTIIKEIVVGIALRIHALQVCMHDDQTINKSHFFNVLIGLFQQLKQIVSLQLHICIMTDNIYLQAIESEKKFYG